MVFWPSGTYHRGPRASFGWKILLGEPEKYLPHPVLSEARGSSYPPYFLRVPSRHVAAAKPETILRICLQVTLY